MPGAGDNYVLCKRSGQETILRPYEYSVGGKTVMMTNLVVPIRYRGPFCGAAGIDIPLDNIQKMLSAEKPYGTGFVSLLSNDANFVAHADPKLLGEPVGAEARASDILAAARDGKELGVTRSSKIAKDDALTTVAPVAVGSTGTPWAVVVNVPVSKVMAPAARLRNISPVAGLLSIDAGEVDVDIDVASHGEIGELGHAFATLVEGARGQAEAARRIAEGDLTVTVTPRSERDVLGHALADMASGLHAVMAYVAREVAGVVDPSAGPAASVRQAGTVSAGMARSIREVAMAAEQAATTSQEIARGPEQQARGSTDAASAMERLQTSIRVVQKGSDRQRAAAEELDRLAQRVRALLDRFRLHGNAGIVVEAKREMLKRAA